MILQRNAHQAKAIWLLLFLAACSASLLLTATVSPARVSAATNGPCVPSGDRGVVTQTLSNVTAGTYRAWSRMMAGTSGNDSYFLEITSGTTVTCYVVGDNTGISNSAWTWLDYQDGTTTNKINHTFPAGTSTIKMIGREDGVKLDRVMFLSNGCTPAPTGNGDDCAVNQNQAPTVSSLTPANGSTITSSPVNISATANDVDGSIQRVDFQIDNGTVQQDTTAPYGITWNPTSSDNGSHTIKATPYDNNGLAGQTVTNTVTVNITPVDTTGPSVSITSPAGGGTVNGTAAINATATDASGINRVEFFINNATTPFATDTTSPYSANWDSTTVANGNHTIRVRAYDNANGQNMSESSITVNVNNVTPDTTPPTVTMTAPVNGAVLTTSPVTLTATASDTSGIFRVEFYQNSTFIGASTNSSSPFSLSWNTSGMTNGSYTIYARAFDNSPNRNTANSTTVTVTVNNPDVTKPTAPGNLRATSTNPNQVVLAWDASSDDRGVTAYSVSRNGTVLNNNVTGTTYTDSTAVPSTSYTYTVTARDAAGNVSDPSNSLGVTTPSAPDTQAPSTPAGLSATAISSSQINMSWSASTDNIGVARYDIYRNGTKIGQATGLSYGDTGLTASTSYSYYVRAIDAAGNQSSNSNTAQATTPAPTDTTPPTVSITYPQDNAPLSGTVNITATAADNSGTVTKVDFYIDGKPSHTDTSAPYTYNWNSASVANGAHVISAIAYDPSNNQRSSTAVNVNITNGTLKAGDVDGDGVVGIKDATRISINWKKTGVVRSDGDLNGDNVVNLTDATIVSINWGK